VDLNTTAFRIVKALTEEKTEAAASKRAAKKRGGEAGGVARTKALSAQRRLEIALAGASARWGKKGNG
jgi:hypothetical protein